MQEIYVDILLSLAIDGAFALQSCCTQADGVMCAGILAHQPDHLSPTAAGLAADGTKSFVFGRHCDPHLWNG